MGPTVNNNILVPISLNLLVKTFSNFDCMIKIHSLEYQWSTTSCCKDIRIRKSEFGTRIVPYILSYITFSFKTTDIDLGFTFKYEQGYPLSDLRDDCTELLMSVY